MAEMLHLLIIPELLFTLGYVALMFYFLWKWNAIQVGDKNSISEITNLPFVSVIVPVRNEIENLPVILAALNGQDFPKEKVEFLFVNDHSDDGSSNFLEQINQPGFQVIHLDNSFGKKAALTSGITHAKGEWILTTDADCSLSVDWISSLINCGVTNHAVMVCGLVRIIPNDKFSSWFQYIEGAVLQVCGAAALSIGKPLLNTGASLAFRKDCWQEIKGYSTHANIASGDDTFLMLEMNEKYPGRVIPCTTGGGIASTVAANSFKMLFMQRIRWAGKTKYYHSSFINFTGLIVVLAAFSVLIAFIAVLIDAHLWKIFFSVLFLRGIAELSLLRKFPRNHSFKGANREPNAMAETSLEQPPYHFQMLMVIIYPFFTLMVLLASAINNPEWKGRKL
ncbi:glycosyltransferase [soil metagenome]